MSVLLLALLLTAAPETQLAATSSPKNGKVIDSSQVPSEEPVNEAALTPKVRVRIDGALVFPAEVYLEILEVPPKARADEKTAAHIRQQLLSFLKRTGFELARVKASVVDGGILVEVDEGQIERIVFMGQLSYQLIQFKLSLVLPNDVFNRRHFDRQVRELSESLNVPGVRWELVRTSTVKHEGPQVVESEMNEDFIFPDELVIRARRPFEVRVYLPDNSVGTTLGVHLQTDFLNGIQLGLTYPRRDLIGIGDRLRIETTGGFGLRSRLDTQRVYPHFSRAYVGVDYDSAPFLKKLRLNTVFQTEWLARQRGDLLLENYNAVTATGAFQLLWEQRQGLRFLAGFGLEWRRLFGYEPGFPDMPPLESTTQNRTRSFLRLTTESVFDASVLRWGRRHTLNTEIRQYLASGAMPGMGWVDARYQFVKEFGWNDVWVRSRGVLSWGEVTFHDERSAGEFLRGVFGQQFVPSAVNLQLEYRLSLARDLLKVSVFHDLALLAAPLRIDPRLQLQLANSFGPGLHFLLADLFQLDMYMAFGFRRRGEFGAAFSLQFAKAF